MRCKKNSRRPAHAGFSLVEMMIAVAILAVIFVPLVKIMTASLKTWWFTRAKMTIQSDGREAMSYMSKEFQGAYRYSMGNLLYNAGFEGCFMDSDLKYQPYLWPAANYTDIVYNQTASTVVVASGYASVTLKNGGARYRYTGPEGNGFKIEKDGTEVVFSFRAKVSSGATAATDITGEVNVQYGANIFSTGTAGVSLSSTTWQRFVVVGAIPDAAQNYEVAFKTTNGNAVVDEVSVIPTHSVLLDPDSANINVSYYMYVSQTAGGAPGEPESLFKIDERMLKGGGIMKRLNCYSVEYSATGAASGVKTRFYNALAENLRKIEFILDAPPTDLAVKGPDTPVTIVMQMGTKVKGKSADDPTKFTLRTTIYPRK